MIINARSVKGLVCELDKKDEGYLDRLNERMIESAGVTSDVWREAENRVYFDGWFGPCTQEDWEEECDGNSLTVGEALNIIMEGAEAVEDYYECEEVEYEDGDIFEHISIAHSRQAILESRFAYLVDIYGTVNL